MTMSVSICSTDSFIPTWITIGFLFCSFCLLLLTSRYSFKVLSSSPEKAEKALTTTLTINAAEDTHWDELGCFKKFKLWIKDIWKRKGIYLPIIAHLSDTATDFAAVYEFYQIALKLDPDGIYEYQINRESGFADCNGLNMWWVFRLSVLCMLFYRLLSSITIYRMTRSCSRVLLQFLDIELYHILYISHMIGSTSKSSPQRFISMMEAVFESAPQAILQTIYLMRTDSFGLNIIFISSILSFINLTMTIINDDSQFWKSSRAEEETGRCFRFMRYIFLRLFRILDVPSTILSFIFLWYFAGGFVAAIFICIDGIIAFICYCKTQNTDAMMGVIVIPFSFGNTDNIRCLNIYWLYSILRSLALNVVVWGFYINKNDLFSLPIHMLYLWLFCSFGSIIKWILFIFLEKCLHFYSYNELSKERSNLNAMICSQLYGDVIELIYYKNLNTAENTAILHAGGSARGYHFETNEHTLLAIAAGAQNNKLFHLILTDYGLDYFPDDDGYRTGLIEACAQSRIDYIETIFDHPDINWKYIVNTGVVAGSALYHCITWGYNKDSETVYNLVVAFLDHVDNMIGDDYQKRIQLLDTMSKGENVLHVICQHQPTLKLFKLLYYWYPNSYQRTALEKEYGTYETWSIMKLCDSNSYYGTNRNEIKEFVLSEL